MLLAGSVCHFLSQLSQGLLGAIVYAFNICQLKLYKAKENRRKKNLSKAGEYTHRSVEYFVLETEREMEYETSLFLVSCTSKSGRPPCVLRF